MILFNLLARALQLVLIRLLRPGLEELINSDLLDFSHDAEQADVVAEEDEVAAA